MHPLQCQRMWHCAHVTYRNACRACRFTGRGCSLPSDRLPVVQTPRDQSWFGFKDKRRKESREPIPPLMPVLCTYSQPEVGSARDHMLIIK